jgi:uncharacterized protein (TIGR02266 family)
MFQNKRDSVEMPIDLRFRKVGSQEEEPLQLWRQKQRSEGRHAVRKDDDDRLQLEVEVSLWSESQFYAGLSGDASQAGLFVATYRTLRPGESVLLRVELFGERIEVVGLVRWRRAFSEHAPPGVGVALSELPPNARRLIDAFCAERAPMYYEFENDERPSA